MFGVFNTPCPNCGSKVEYKYYSPGCDTPHPQGGIYCTNENCCNEYSITEWLEISAGEIIDKRLISSLLDIERDRAFRKHGLTCCPI